MGRNIFKKYICSMVLGLSVITPLFSGFTVSAEAPLPVSSTYNGMVAVYGELGTAYADKTVNLLLLEGDYDTFADNKIAYIDSTNVTEEGCYAFRFECDEIINDAKDGKVDDYSLYVGIEGENVTDSIITADIEGKKQSVAKISFSKRSDAIEIIADVFNLYGQNVKGTLFAVGYDSDNRIVGVSTPAVNESNTDTQWRNIFDNFENPLISYIKAYLWEDFATMVPLCGAEQYDISAIGTEHLVINPGASADERRFAWYNADTESVGRLIYEEKDSYVENNNSFSDNAVIVNAQTGDVYSENYVWNFAEASRLSYDTDYVYAIGTAHTFDLENVNEFHVDNPEDGFTFGVISDIHAGQNQNGKNHTTLWDDTLNALYAKNDDIAFVLSAGDQVTNTRMEDEYTELFKPELTKTIPLAPAMGITHDFGSKGYWDTLIAGDVNLESKAGFHYNMPNMSKTQGYVANSVGDYWFRYGDALIVVINYSSADYTTYNGVSGKYNKNRYTMMTNDLNAQFVADAVRQNTDAKWKIVMTHISPYPMWGKETEFEIYRRNMTQICDENDIDVLFSGHTHTYLRTRSIKDIGNDGMFDIVDDGEGTVYISVAPVKQSWDTLEGEGLTEETNVPYTEYGAKYYGDVKSSEGTTGSAFNGHSSMVMANVTDSDMTIKLYDVTTGEERDSVTLTK